MEDFKKYSAYKEDAGSIATDSTTTQSVCNSKINNVGRCEKCHQVALTSAGYCIRLIEIADMEEKELEGWEHSWEEVTNQLKDGVNPHAYRLGFLKAKSLYEQKPSLPKEDVSDINVGDMQKESIFESAQAAVKRRYEDEVRKLNQTK